MLFLEKLFKLSKKLVDIEKYIQEIKNEIKKMVKKKLDILVMAINK